MYRSQFLLCFAQDFFSTEIKQFREAEIKSLCKLFGLTLNILNDHRDGKPFWIVETDKDEASVKQLASRSFTIKYALRLYAYSESIPIFHKKFNDSLATAKFFNKPDSFRITVETFNKKITQQEKVAKIETLDYLPLKGPVDLKSPELDLFYIEYYGLNSSQPFEEPHVFFGEKVGNFILELMNFFWIF